jgi:hypothetical protein
MYNCYKPVWIVEKRVVKENREKHSEFIINLRIRTARQTTATTRESWIGWSFFE